MKAEMKLEEFMARYQDSGNALPANDVASITSQPSEGEAFIAAVWEMKAEQKAYQNSLNDLQRQIDLQRNATAELAVRSQSSAAVLEKFEEVAQSTAAAAEQLEAETILVRSCCNSTRQATTKDIAAFRSELEESRGKHYADIASLCAEFAGNGEAFPPRARQAQDSIAKPELAAMMEARDRSLRDQMTQALDTSSSMLSRNFLEEHRKVLVEILEERESRVHEANQMRTRLDAVLAVAQAIQKDGSEGRSADAGAGNVAGNSQLQSMRDAISQLRASIEEEGRGNSRRSDGSETRASEDGDQEGGNKVGSRAATERFIFDSLATIRKDISSCVDAANAAVRLGEQLTNELNIEVDLRCSDVKSLREWVCQVLEVTPAPNSIIASEDSRISQNIDDASRLPTNTASHSPFPGPRELSTTNLAYKKRGENDLAGNLFTDLGQGLGVGQSMTALPTRSASTTWQQGYIQGGSQTLPRGVSSTGPPDPFTGLPSPGLRLSGGNPVGMPIRQQSTTMPAGDRYLASQRQQQIQSQYPGATGAAGSNGPVGQLNMGSASPRQARVHSPLRNYLLPHSTHYDSVMAGQADHGLRRQQASSPLRDSHRDVLAPTFAAHQATLQAAAAAAAAAGLNNFGMGGSPMSAPVLPNMAMASSRRMTSPVRMTSTNEKLARSLSPVQIRTSAA